MRIAFAADHAGAAFKRDLIGRLAGALGGEHTLVDLGGDGSDPQDDYPDFARVLGEAVRDGDADRGILVCGSGVGASIAANKIRGIRAGLCHDTYSAHQGVEHDDMNVLTLGARVIGIEPAVEISLAFIHASFSGEPRHVRRLDKVLAIEAASMGEDRRSGGQAVRARRAGAARRPGCAVAGAIATTYACREPGALSADRRRMDRPRDLRQVEESDDRRASG